VLNGNPMLKPRYGFVWNQGRIIQLDVPRSLATVAYGINNAGQITGACADAAGRRHGFLLQRGRYTTIDVPGRPETGAAWGINDRGQIVMPELGTGLGTGDQMTANQRAHERR
jgi:probable HAF family extracellular repeat protein